MQLADFVTQYLQARPVSAGYARTLAKRTTKLATFAGRGDLATVLTETTVNAFLAQLGNLSRWWVSKSVQPTR